MKYDIQTFRAFIEVAEHGTIAKAALVENTVPSAISRRISELEAFYGTKLLYRHRRGISLTSAGIEFLSHARKVMAELAELDHSLEQFANGVRGQVRLLANTSAVVQFLASDIATFLENHPSIKIDLEERTSDQIQRAILEGKADIGILITGEQDERLVFRPYRVDQLVLLMSITHPLANSKNISFADTLTYDYVGLPQGTSFYKTLNDAAQDLNIPLKLRIQTTSFEGIRKMVSEGLGIGILPQNSVLPYLDIENLIAIPLQEEWSLRTLQIATRERYSMTRVAQLLSEHLALQYSAMPK